MDIFHAALFRICCLLLVCTAAAHGQTGPQLLLEPFVEERRLAGSADGYVLDRGDIRNTEDSYRLGLADLQARYRLLPQARVDPRVGGRLLYVDVATTSPLLPDGLIDASAGIAFGLFAYDGWRGGLSIGVGYAGVADETFADANAWYYRATLVAGRRLSPREQLGVVLDYDGNRAFMPDVPLPGFVYRRLVAGNPDPGPEEAFEPRLLLTLGVPFVSINWQPTERFSFELTWAMLDDLSATADLALDERGTFGAFGSVTARRSVFHWNDLPDNRRLMLRQRQAEAGMRWNPTRDVRLLVAGGYAFGQKFTTGWDVRNETTLANLSDEPYLRLGAQFTY